MKTNIEIKNIAKDTISQEIKAIENLKNFINDDFVKVVQLIFSSKGRVIITGIGKSANIATKIVSTLNSTGTPSLFMHAAEAIHGDLGMVQKDDIVICISKSGNTPEIKVLIPLIKANNNTLVALVGDNNSFLAQRADYVLSCYVDKEADPNNLAPTSSTTAQLVMGDALAVCLLWCRGFSSRDFAKYHPGGSLGKRLYLKVSDLYVNNEKPQISPATTLNQALIEISSKRLGCCAVIDNDAIVGIITDGDLRRMLSKQNNSITLDILAKDVMSKNPKTIKEDAFAVEALEIMRNNHITQLLVTDNNNKYLGVVHLHDLIQEGII
ncbi:MAG: KpsF/GutQ family sugar-phosphate isomerase [Bacteroidales bacterium]|jgi:arabinose-5-phosphate isomerase|nr:KpsF/GutQ family sugar-phosphate isomerase [Bacteroidales bacterium]